MKIGHEFNNRFVSAGYMVAYSVGLMYLEIGHRTHTKQVVSDGFLQHIKR